MNSAPALGYADDNSAQDIAETLAARAAKIKLNQRSEPACPAAAPITVQIPAPTIVPTPQKVNHRVPRDFFNSAIFMS